MVTGVGRQRRVNTFDCFSTGCSNMTDNILLVRDIDIIRDK